MKLCECPCGMAASELCRKEYFLQATDVVFLTLRLLFILLALHCTVQIVDLPTALSVKGSKKIYRLLVRGKLQLPFSLLYKVYVVGVYLYISY
ncbi:hypothetical protein V1521DRAFT_424924 [Lipomyces starkeyi]